MRSNLSSPRILVRISSYFLRLNNVIQVEPMEARKDLRAGIRAKNQGNFALSEWFFARYVLQQFAFAFSFVSSLSIRSLLSCSYRCACLPNCLGTPVVRVRPRPMPQDQSWQASPAFSAEVSPERRAKEVVTSLPLRRLIPQEMPAAAAATTG